MRINFLFRGQIKILRKIFMHKPFVGFYEVPQKIGPDRINSFDVHKLQTNRQAKLMYTI